MSVQAPQIPASLGRRRRGAGEGCYGWAWSWMKAGAGEQRGVYGCDGVVCVFGGEGASGLKDFGSIS